MDSNRMTNYRLNCVVSKPVSIAAKATGAFTGSEKAKTLSLMVFTSKIFS